MAPEPPNHLVIGTDSTQLSEYDKVLPSLFSHNGHHETPTGPKTSIPDPLQSATSPTKADLNKPEKTWKHIYRIEYTDNTEAVIAVKKGATPPIQSSDQGHDTPVFELIKRIKVFAKGPNDSKMKSKDDKSPSGGKDDSPSTEKKDGTEGKKTETKSILAGKDTPETVKDKTSDNEDDKLKDFDISPDSSVTWSLKILSEPLMNALRAVVEYYPGLQLLSHNAEFNEPYK